MKTRTIICATANSVAQKFIINTVALEKCFVKLLSALSVKAKKT